MSLARVGIGIPVWRGADFVAETIDCMLSQRDVAVDIFISIDGADHESERTCRPFASDPRVRIAVQPEQLGWVKNCAVALSGAATNNAPYVCLQPHDDLADSDYLCSLVELADKRPDAAVVYSDIDAFGTCQDVIAQPDVDGSPVERQLLLLTRHFSAVAFRGLTRTSALARVPAISGNSYENFACDTVWMARLARAGDLIRVPRSLYRKRYHGANTHMQWNGWSADRKAEAWLQHCLDMLAEALCVCSSPGDVRRVVAAARARAINDRIAVGPYHADLVQLSRADRRRLLRRFDDICAARFQHELPATGREWARDAWQRTIEWFGPDRSL